MYPLIAYSLPLEISTPIRTIFSANAARLPPFQRGAHARLSPVNGRQSSKSNPSKG